VPPRKPLSVNVPAVVAEEIGDAARRLHRSPAFIARRALAAAPNAELSISDERVPFILATDEDDPADTLTKIKAAASGRSLDEALTAAWITTRARFHAWIAREEHAGAAEHAHDLDSALRDARDPSIDMARLIELATSEYPKVRALVAAHPACTKELLEKLAADKEPYVRDAVANRR
jgi:hypothetical protein